MDSENCFSLINRIEWDNDIQAYKLKNTDSTITSKRYTAYMPKHEYKSENYDMMI